MSTRTTNSRCSRHRNGEYLGTNNRSCPRSIKWGMLRSGCGSIVDPRDHIFGYLGICVSLIFIATLMHTMEAHANRPHWWIRAGRKVLVADGPQRRSSCGSPFPWNKSKDTCHIHIKDWSVPKQLNQPHHLKSSKINKHIIYYHLEFIYTIIWKTWTLSASVRSASYTSCLITRCFDVAFSVSMSPSVGDRCASHWKPECVYCVTVVARMCLD